jgi:hypothetical protein
VPGGREAALFVHGHLTFFHETATDTAAVIVAQLFWLIIALDLIVVCTSGIVVKRGASMSVYRVKLKVKLCMRTLSSC